jgi:hypothetical protein
MDPYRPEGWHDFFLATAGAAAALTGLLFVAMSLHMRYIATDPYYRNLARGSLVGLVSVLLVSLIVLVDQPARWVGIELVVFAVLFLVAEGRYDAINYRRLSGGPARATLIRSAVGALLALAGLAGGLTIAFQAGPGLYAIALVLITVTVWNLLNAWTLLIGVTDEEIAHQGR